MESTAERLAYAREKAGFETAKDAAEAMGINYSTYLSHESGGRGIKRSSLDLYAKRFKVTVEWLLLGNGKAERPAAPETSPQVLGLPVVGVIAAGSWLEIDADNVVPGPSHIGIGSDARFPRIRQYALLVSGDSMDQLFPDGSYVTCIDYGDAGMELRTGLVVHVERSRDSGLLIETTLKEIASINGEMVLSPRSTNPKHRPIVVNGDEGTEITIRGIVTGMWMPRQL